MKDKIKKRLEESRKTRELMDKRISEYEALLEKLEQEPELDTLAAFLSSEEKGKA